MVARKVNGQPAEIDFSKAMCCNLEGMLRDGAITSVRAFFETIFRFGEQYKGNEPSWSLSDKLGVSVGGNLISDMLFSLIPEELRKAYKSGKHFAIRDVSR